jgi:hypothetical protein
VLACLALLAHLDFQKLWAEIESEERVLSFAPKLYKGEINNK